jgi:hypothetical protein
MGVSSVRASRQAFPFQADSPLDAAGKEGSSQCPIHTIEFEIAPLIRPHPVGEEGGLDVVDDDLFMTQPPMNRTMSSLNRWSLFIVDAFRCMLHQS